LWIHKKSLTKKGFGRFSFVNQSITVGYLSQHLGIISSLSSSTLQILQGLLKIAG
jgi:hypothetical protein